VRKQRNCRFRRKGGHQIQTEKWGISNNYKTGDYGKLNRRLSEMGSDRRKQAKEVKNGRRQAVNGPKSGGIKYNRSYNDKILKRRNNQINEK